MCTIQGRLSFLRVLVGARPAAAKGIHCRGTGRPGSLELQHVGLNVHPFKLWQIEMGQWGFVGQTRLFICTLFSAAYGRQDLTVSAECAIPLHSLEGEDDRVAQMTTGPGNRIMWATADCGRGRVLGGYNRFSLPNRAGAGRRGYGRRL